MDHYKEIKNELYFLVCGNPAASTGGNVYNRKISDMLVKRGWPVGWLVIEDYPAPGDLLQESAMGLLSVIPAGSAVMIDSLLFSTLAPVLPLFYDKLMLIHMDHMPYYLHPALGPDERERRKQEEKRALQSAHLVITTSEYTTQLIQQDFAPEIPVHTVEPGINARAVKKTYPHVPERLLTVANVLPSKGYDLLVEALFPLKALSWNLHIVGDEEMDPDYARKVRQQIQERGLSNRIHFQGPIPEEDLWLTYARSDLFLLPTRKETFGMVISEAIAAGLPVITTKTGGTPHAFKEGCGIMLPVDDHDAFRDAVETCLRDPSTYRRYINNVKKARTGYPGWDQAADRILDAINQYYPF